MSETGTWRKALLSAGVAASAAAVLCYCVSKKGDHKKAKKESVGGSTPGDAAPLATKTMNEDITKESVQQILKEIIGSQDKMKGYMKELTDELLAKPLTFDQTYERVKSARPEDPLEKHNLSMSDFDKLLDKHQSDPKVREAIAKIMGAPNPSSVASKKVQSITVKEIVQVHTFMLRELEALVDHLQGITNKDELEMKSVTIAAQAIAGAKMEAKFGHTSEDVESAVLMYHTMLATNQEFNTVIMQIQHTMGKLMGNPLGAT